MAFNCPFYGEEYTTSFLTPGADRLSRFSARWRPAQVTYERANILEEEEEEEC